MEIPSFVSQIDDNVSYDKYFEVTEIDEDDNDYESNLYKIGIFGNMHHIAMGKKRVHTDNKLLVLFIAYLVHNDKVVAKLGIFEKLYKDEESAASADTNSVNFEGERLLVHPKYFKMLQYLEEFSVDEEEPKSAEEDGEEKAEEIDENEVVQAKEDAENGEQNIVKIKDESIVLKRNLEKGERYSIIKSLSKSGKALFKIRETELQGKLALKNVLNILKVFMKLYLENIESKDKKNAYKKEFGKVKTMFFKKNEKSGKSALYFHELIVLAAESSEHHYATNVFVLALLEYICNVKFVILEDGEVTDFSLFRDDFVKSMDFMSQIDSYEMTSDIIKSYDPDCFYVVEKGEDGSFSFLEYNGSAHITMVENNKPFIDFVKELYEKKNHEFVYDTQLSKLKAF